MKIVSWNVNGIRSCHRKGELLKFLDGYQPDVLCLQEVRALPEQLGPDLLSEHGYHVEWHPAEKKGYAGTATFSKSAPERVTRGLGIEAFDSEGRVLITRHEGVLIANVYFPHGQRDHARLPFKRDFYRAMHAWGQKERAQGELVIICGDWNTSHKEVDIKNWKANRKTSGFTDEERALVDEFVDVGWHDSFREMHPEARDVYSWWSNRAGVRERNVGWRIDYHFVADELWPRVSGAQVHMDVYGSDHCPVEVRLDGSV